jgi:hypothetical protein
MSERATQRVLMVTVQLVLLARFVMSIRCIVFACALCFVQPADAAGGGQHRVVRTLLTKQVAHQCRHCSASSMHIIVMGS